MAVDSFRAPPRARGDRAGAGAGAPVARLLDVMPELGDAVPRAERELARGALLARVSTVESGTVALPPSAGRGRPSALLVVGGVLLRETQLRERAVGELLGVGDVVDAPVDDVHLLACHTRHVVYRPVTVVLLDDRFRAVAARWPGIDDALACERTRQAARGCRHLAALVLPRVEDRVIAIFYDLADRWGRVTPDGIRIDLPLTHAVIGQLVGASRPTVSLALADLAADGRLRRRDDQAWQLRADVAALE